MNIFLKFKTEYNHTDRGVIMSLPETQIKEWLAAHEGYTIKSFQVLDEDVVYVVFENIVKKG